MGLLIKQKISEKFKKFYYGDKRVLVLHESGVQGAGLGNTDSRQNPGAQMAGSKRGVSVDSEEGNFFALKFWVGLTSRQKGFCLLEGNCDK